MWPAPVTLSGKHCSLVPLEESHAADLAEASADGDLHQLWYTTASSPEGVPAEITRRLNTPKMTPFAILDVNGTAIGMTTYMNTDAKTVVSKSVQPTIASRRNAARSTPNAN